MGDSMNILLFDDYKQLLRAKIKTMPRRGHGQVDLMAKALGVHQSFVSQVLNTDRNLSDEQAFLICRHFRFTDIESEYFVALVQLGRCTNSGLRELLKKNLLRIRNQTSISEALDRNITALAEEDKQVFYSNWCYMAVWLLTAVPQMNTVESISRQLHQPQSRIKEIINFLTRVGLCEEKNGKLSIKIKRTLVTSGSPMLSRHHMNWRLRAMDTLQSSSIGSVFYTHPMAISEKDAMLIKEILIKTIANIEPLVEPSPAEKIYCLNIDWFEN